MSRHWNRHIKGVTKGRSLLGVVAILMVVALVAAACGEDEEEAPAPTATSPAAAPTATSPAAAPTATTPAGEEPQPTATSPAAAPTATSPAEVPSVLRPKSEWTVDNPATLAEIEAALETHRGETLNFNSWGGAYQAAQRQAFLVPLEERFGIEIIETFESGNGTALIRAQVEAGNVTWDVVDLTPPQIVPLITGGFLEELDFSVVDTRDFMDVTVTPYTGGGAITWSIVMAYNTDFYSEEGRRPPESWADFWDVNFDGRRGYGNFMPGHLEFAMLAAGFTADEVFPLTLEKEEILFQKLEDLAPILDKFWSAGSTPPEDLISGELTITSAWNGRIFDAQLEGAPIAICWECGYTIATDDWLIPLGAPNKELAELVIAWASFPEIQVQVSKYITYGPVNLAAIPLLADVVSAEVLAELPSAPQNVPFAVLEDELWMGENWDRLNDRYLAIFQE
ncbi:MAG: extracellular solute-binding protein [Dehalococcoidia bacterium]